MLTPPAPSLPPNAASRRAVPARSIIGRSALGRTIGAERIGQVDAPLRILLVAGQHGDERRPCHVLHRVARRLARPDVPQPMRRLRDALDSGAACITIVSCLNPDGYTARRRTNALGIDLNRDHQTLRAPETQALHRLVGLLRPQLVLDLHTYPARRLALLEERLIRGDDLCIDWPTNPLAARRCQAETLGPLVLEGLLRRFSRVSDSGRSAGRYFVLSSGGSVRHGTADVVDARNALALRYGCLTLLLEGRQKTNLEPPEAARHLNRMLRQGVEAVLRWAQVRVADLAALPADVGRRVPIRCRYERASAGFSASFLDAATLRPLRATLPGTYKPHARPTRHVRLPWAYAVPLAHADLIDALERHGFARWHGATIIGQAIAVEAYRILQVRPSRRAGLPPLRVQVRPERTLLADEELLSQHAIFRADGPDAAALAMHLEPHAKYSLHREASMMAALGPKAVGGLFPVVRLILTATPTHPKHLGTLNVERT